MPFRGPVQENDRASARPKLFNFRFHPGAGLARVRRDEDHYGRRGKHLSQYSSIHLGLFIRNASSDPTPILVFERKKTELLELVLECECNPCFSRPCLGKADKDVAMQDWITHYLNLGKSLSC